MRIQCRTYKWHIETRKGNSCYYCIRCHWIQVELFVPVTRQGHIAFVLTSQLVSYWILPRSYILTFNCPSPKLNPFVCDLIRLDQSALQTVPLTVDACTVSGTPSKGLRRCFIRTSEKQKPNKQKKNIIFGEFNLCPCLNQWHFQILLLVWYT